MLRVEGDMVAVGMPSLQETEVDGFIKSTMSDAQYNEFQKNLELDYAFYIPKMGRFRINAFTQSRGTAAVFRVIPSTVPSLEQLHLDHTSNIDMATSVTRTKLSVRDSSYF